MKLFRKPPPDLVIDADAARVAAGLAHVAKIETIKNRFMHKAYKWIHDTIAAGFGSNQTSIPLYDITRDEVDVVIHELGSKGYICGEPRKFSNHSGDGFVFEAHW